MSQTARDIARELDVLGITAIDFRDPEDGTPVTGIRLADAAILIGALRQSSGLPPADPLPDPESLELRWKPCDATFDCEGTHRHAKHCPRKPARTEMSS